MKMKCARQIMTLNQAAIDVLLLKKFDRHKIEGIEHASFMVLN